MCKGGKRFLRFSHHRISQPRWRDVRCRSSLGVGCVIVGTFTKQQCVYTEDRRSIRIGKLVKTHASVDSYSRESVARKKMRCYKKSTNAYMSWGSMCMIVYYSYCNCCRNLLDNQESFRGIRMSLKIDNLKSSSWFKDLLEILLIVCRNHGI